MIPSRLRLIRERLWRTARNVAARLDLLPHKSGTYEGAQPAELVASARQYLKDYRDFGLTEASLAGKTVLEVGPGNNLLVPLLFLAGGASQVVCIDRFEAAPDPGQSQAAYAQLWSELTEVERGRCAGAWTGDGARPSRDVTQPLVYLWDCAAETAPARLGAERFDLIVSRAALEHVYSPQETIDALWKLLKPGGRMVHKVDLRSHEEESEVHPLEFLCHPPGWWSIMTSHTGEPNRVRKTAFVELVRKRGFDVRKVEVTHRVTPAEVAEIRPRLAGPFRSLSDEDLQDTGIFIDAYRPA